MPEHYRFVAKHLKAAPRADYSFRAKVAIFSGGGTWYYVMVPPKTSAVIKKRHGAHARGWGSHPVAVTLGRTEWRTSIFPYKGTYLLLLKAAVRKKENVVKGSFVRVRMTVGA